VKTVLREYLQAVEDPDPYTNRIARNRISELTNDPARTLRLLDFEERIVPATLSPCCNARAIFVLSRRRGFVAISCTRCLRSSHARLLDFPRQECCGRRWTVFVGELDRNYRYRCGTCGRGFRVADIVPHWEALELPVSPVTAPGDDWRY